MTDARRWAWIVVIALLLGSGCGKHVVQPDDPDFSTLAASTTVSGTEVTVDTRAPRAKRLGVDQEWMKKYEATDLKGMLQERVTSAAEVYGLRPSARGVRLEADFTKFNVNREGMVAGRDWLVSIAGEMRLIDNQGVIFQDAVLVEQELDEADGPEIAFVYFDTAVAEWFTRLENQLRASPELAARVSSASGTVIARTDGSTAEPASDAAAGEDVLLRVENSRRKRVGRAFFSTLLGGAFAVGGAIGAHQLMNAACLDYCGTGHLLAEMGAIIVLTPVGTTLGGAALDGLGNYGWAILGSTGAFLAALSANSGGSSEEEARLIGVKATIGAVIAPIMATVIYEMGSVLKEKRLEARGGIALVPMQRPDGANVPGLQLSFTF